MAFQQLALEFLPSRYEAPRPTTAFGGASKRFCYSGTWLVLNESFTQLSKYWSAKIGQSLFSIRNRKTSL